MYYMALLNAYLYLGSWTTRSKHA